LLDGRNSPAERASHLAGGHAHLGERLRFNQVAHSLGLGKVEPAGEKGALSEFARLSQPRSQIERTAKQELQDNRRSVRGNLDEVLAGVGVGSGEPGDKSFIDSRRLGLFGSVSPSVEHIRQACATMLERQAETDQLDSDRNGLWSTQADNADAAPAGWRGDCGNCVVIRLGSRGGVRHVLESV
jgi:hypothetical protein